MRLCVAAACLALAPTTLIAQVTVEQQSGTTALLQAVSAIDAHTAWVSGHRATVLLTIDGGSTWTRRMVTDADSALEFRDVHAIDAKTAWVLAAGPGAKSRIYHTSDGGASWALQFTNADSAAFFDCFTFFDRKRGVAFSDAAGGRTLVLRTENGGQHWMLLPATAVPQPLDGEGAFAASGGCVTSHGKRNAWITTGSPGARVMRSTDAGRSWTGFATPFVHGEGAGMTAASFRDAKHGIGVGARISMMSRDTAAAAVGVTSDGGRTWTLRNRPDEPGAIFGVAAVPKSSRATAAAAALSGLWITRDDARSWNRVASGAFWSVGAADRFAWGVGSGGRIVRVDFSGANHR
ncbi:MAG: YCF48-related protein [Gemmatimonadales bacterium]